MPTREEWIKDGTVETAPVTTSTPAVDESTAADTSGAVAAVAAEATAEATAQGATAEQAAAVGEQAAQEFIEGRVGDQPFQVPKNLSLPWKRGSEEGFVSIEEIRGAHMFERDYRVKTAELATQRRQAETNQRVAEARIAAQQKMLDEMAEEQSKAYASPEEQARYEAFLEQYRTNPYFRQQVDDARQGRVMAAEREAVADIQYQESLYAETEGIVSTILDLGKQYPQVDPELIRQRYAAELEADRLPISKDAIEGLFKAEAQSITRYTAPIQSELDTLRREFAELRAANTAQAHNDKTRQAIERTQSPVGAPAGGNAPTPTPPAANLKGKTLHERSREWSNIR